MRSVGLSKMSKRASQQYMWIFAGLTSYGVCQSAKAADFQLSPDFMVAELSNKRRQAGLDAASLTSLPAQNLALLMAKVQGQNAKPKQQLPQKTAALISQPSIFVQSPQTRGELVKV